MKAGKKNSKFWFLLLTSLTLLTSSCNVSKYLKNSESLLKESKILFKSNAKITDKKTLEKELQAFIPEKPNSKLLFFIPKEWIYLKNSEPGDSSWIDKGMRSIGEPPSFYVEAKSVEISNNMESFLKYKKGYYEAKVDFIVDEKLFKNTSSTDIKPCGKSKVSYIVSLDKRYKIGAFKYQSIDQELLTFIQSIKLDAYIKSGDYIDYSRFDLEKSRITLALQNHGYANFSNNFISVEGDSSKVNKTIDIIIDIKTPLPDTIHKKFKTGQIKVYTDYYKDQENIDLIEDTIANIKFLRQSQNFLVKPDLLTSSIFFREGNILRREERQKTFRKLNSLGTYRFVTINPFPVRDSIMNFDVF
ncbi:MAG: hypothetical protein IPO92_15415 [Saprospiraceae bacterium]|nr:hypothetical protein [Saprospiraceae bacterium]